MLKLLSAVAFTAILTLIMTVGVINTINKQPVEVVQDSTQEDILNTISCTDYQQDEFWFLECNTNEWGAWQIDGVEPTGEITILVTDTYNDSIGVVFRAPPGYEPGTVLVTFYSMTGAIYQEVYSMNLPVDVQMNFCLTGCTEA